MEPETSKKSIVTIIIVIAVVAVGGYFLLSGGGNGENGAAGEPVATPEPTLAPQLQLTLKEKAGDVGGKKAEILQLVRSGKVLTPEQKSEVGGIMLTKAHIYNFSDEERVDIFEALQK